MLPILLIAQQKRAYTKYITQVLKERALHDVHYFGEDEPLNIETIREINVQALQPSFVKRAFVLIGFDLLKNEGQNAFLKTAEEHRDDIQFILVARDEYRVLPTIISRCVVKRLPEALDNDWALLQTLGLFNTHATLAEVLCATQGLKKEHCIKAIAQLRNYLYSKSHMQPALYPLLEPVIEVEYQLKNNIYPEFALDYILLVLTKTIHLPLDPS
ncbi:MAG: DNA polymerase III subunit delta' [Microgenomates bacterium OLB23]|nr:MAG: DNA polymerase III subunit delta' [Microgenomates bacterium OLB23]